MFKNLKKNFFTGIMILLPAIVTIWVVEFLVIRLNRLVLEPTVRHLPAYIGGDFLLGNIIKIAVLSLIILIIAFIGFGTRVLFLSRFFSYWEKKLFQIPMIGKIYSSTKDMSHAFLGQSKGIFTRAVLVEFPYPGTYAIGFVTSESHGEIRDKTMEKIINVFLPTTPNPTSGFLLLIPEKRLVNLDMSIDEGLKLVISGGVFPLPSRIKIKKNNGGNPVS